MRGVVLDPSPSEFLSRRGTANVVPVSCELLADLETPISAYLRLRDLPSSFLLESVEGSAQVARFSVLGGDPRLVLESDGRTVRVTGPAGTVTEPGDPLPGDPLPSDPLRVVQGYLQRYRAEPSPGLPPFIGGFLGFFGYDTVRLWERLPARPPDDLGLPVFRLALMDTVVVFDHRRHTLRIVANAFLDQGAEAAYREAAERIATMVARLRAPRPDVPPAPALRLEARPNMTPAAYCAAVERAKEYIRAGDIFQVILAQRFAVPVPGLDPLAVYRALRLVNPSPYMFLLEAGEATLVGSSPERLVRLEEGRVEMRPLAGTRRRGRDAAEDQALGEALLADPKERAEHVMLVDLTRNDVGRISRYGSVAVTELMAIERYSHVMHLVSHVVGDLAPGRGPWDVFQAVFPHGTVSGAPKVRAMEIIDELEPVGGGLTPGRRVRRPRGAQPGHHHPDGRRPRGDGLRPGRGRSGRGLRPRAGARGVRGQGAGRHDRHRAREPVMRAGDHGEARMVLVVDNYDSFTYNLVQYLGELGATPVVYRNDRISVAEVEALAPAAIVVSPGPGTPAQAGVSNALIRAMTGRRPLLGVCLGHQCIGEVFGERSDARPRRSTARRPGPPRQARSHGFPNRWRRPLPLLVVPGGPPGLPGGLRLDRGRPDHGAPPPPGADRRRPVPPGVDPHHGREGPPPELPRRRRPRGRGRRRPSLPGNEWRRGPGHSER
jgi:anthranilate synthase component 1